MSIEDRVRRVLADAVADEPPLRGAPLEGITHRQRRSRSVLAGAIAMAGATAGGFGVIIQQRDIFSPRQLDALIVRSAKPFVFSVLYQTDRQRRSFERRKRSVRRAVIDDDHFEIGEILSREGGQTADNHVLAVPVNDHYRNNRRFRHS